MNPVDKARKITEVITENVKIQKKLLAGITRELSAEEIEKIYSELFDWEPEYQLKLELC